MANEQLAFIKKTRVSDRRTWQAAIDACGFDFQLDPDLKPFEDSGFLPCKLRASMLASRFTTGPTISTSSPSWLADATRSSTSAGAAA